TTHNITEVTTPSAISGPRGIVVAGNGSTWFTEVNAGKVATVVRSTHIVVTGSTPVHMQLGETFGLTVAVEFDSGDVDTAYNGAVSLALVSNSTATSLLGSTSVMATNGVASFSGLSLSSAGNFSILVKSGSARSATIGPVSVSGPVGSSPV